MQFVFCRCFLVTFIHFIYVRGSFHLSRLWNKVGDKSLKLLKRILLRKLRHVSHYIIWVSSYLPHLHSHSWLYLYTSNWRKVSGRIFYQRYPISNLLSKFSLWKFNLWKKEKRYAGTGIHLRYVFRNRRLILSHSTSKKLLQLR